MLLKRVNNGKKRLDANKATQLRWRATEIDEKRRKSLDREKLHRAAFVKLQLFANNAMQTDAAVTEAAAETAPVHDDVLLINRRRLEHIYAAQS